MKKIAVLCSGGDAPGMNCAIRGVVRTAIGEGLDVYGIQKGYAGLLSDQIYPLTVSSVGNILQRGGTILQTSRCPDFLGAEGRAKGASVLKKRGIEGLVVIGGDGSFQGAMALHEEHGQFPVLGIPGTIDNDMAGTEYTIGFDTAVQTGVQAVDKIRDTASSHDRTFIVEVMGKRSAAIALHVGVCTGAENIVLPSEQIDYQKIANDINRGLHRGKTSSIIVVAEGPSPGICYEIQKQLEKNHDLSAHVCILGHTQRGGSPSPFDRMVASRMGYEAAKALKAGQHPVVTTYNQGRVRLSPFANCLGKKTQYREDYLDVVKALSI